MSPSPYIPPDSESKSDETQPTPATDFQSLMQQPDPGFENLLEKNASAIGPATDFQSLTAGQRPPQDPLPQRTITDTLLGVLTPLMIFFMVYSVIFFLLDVRYIYTEVHDNNLRFVAACFVLGVVALNRIIVRNDSSESILYFIALAFAIGLYTFSTTGMFEVGSVARNFMNDNPYAATAFNLVIVAFIWWLTNRLMHECCVDENKVAGDVGMLTATARRMQYALKRDERVSAPQKKKDVPPPNIFYEFEAFDPTEGYKPKTKPTPAPALADKRLTRHHPGMSIFYFSIPVMTLFSLGLRVAQQGGESMVLAGQCYMALYTLCALTLLLLTSLAGLRQYFRNRRIPMPDRIGWFWIGLGLWMIALVMIGATQLPMPDRPRMLHVGFHETDYWTQTSTFQLRGADTPQKAIQEATQLLDQIGQIVLIGLALFLAYALLKALAALAARIARRRDRYPRIIVRFFDRLEHLLTRFTQLPQRKAPRKRRIRIQLDLATCRQFHNSLSHPPQTTPMSPSDHITYAYDALCALAHDLGVPRQQGQTPNEFLAAFPQALHTLRDEARELTQLHERAAYAPIPPDEDILDRLRKFWITYERARKRVLK